MWLNNFLYVTLGGEITNNFRTLLITIRIIYLLKRFKKWMRLRTNFVYIRHKHTSDSRKYWLNWIRYVGTYFSNKIIFTRKKNEWYHFNFLFSYTKDINIIVSFVLYLSHIYLYIKLGQGFPLFWRIQVYKYCLPSQKFLFR